MSKFPTPILIETDPDDVHCGDCSQFMFQHCAAHDFTKLKDDSPRDKPESAYLRSQACLDEEQAYLSKIAAGMVKDAASDPEYQRRMEAE
jgi:hypothetical protein